MCNGAGKKRPMVNLRHVNQCLWKQKFKYGDLQVTVMLFNPGEWMFTFDHKSVSRTQALFQGLECLITLRGSFGYVRS